MSSYPMTSYQSTDKSLQLPANPLYQAASQHYSTSLHYRQQNHQDNVFKWPHENLDKNANEKFSLSHHPASPKYDISNAKHETNPYSVQYDERDVQQQSYDTARLTTYEARINNNNVVNSKREHYEHVYNRPPFCAENGNSTNAYLKTTAPGLDTRAKSRSSSTSYSFADNTHVRSQPPVMTARSLKDNRIPLSDASPKEDLKSVSKDKNAKKENVFVKTPVTVKDNQLSQEKPDESSSTSNEEKQVVCNDPDKEKTTDELKSDGDKKEGSSSTNNTDLPSYTAMIAQSILKTESNKSTLADIYEYMEKHFPSLERRGTGWRNCVRHTLSLNECFVKLHRPENGRSCNWAIHPTYYEAFTRGDYRKRRAFRKRPRSFPWGDSMMMGGFPFHREHELHPELTQSQQSMYPFHSPHSMWSSSYNTQMSPPNTSNHLQHFYQSSSNTNNNSLYPSNPHHYHSPHCVAPDCFCQYNKANNRPYMN